MIAPAPVAREDIVLPSPLTAGWELATASEPESDSARLRFTPAQVPGTVASSLRSQKAWRMGDDVRFDASEHWFRCRFEADPAGGGEELVLRFGGIATLAEVWLNGERILESGSMFASHDVNVTALVRPQNELLIVCRSLSAALRAQRPRKPAARWRTRVVSEQSLRWFRTTLLGRAPGFSSEPEPVGPWRPVTLLRRRRIVVEDWSRRVTLDGTVGTLAIDLRLRTLGAGSRPVSGRLVVDSAGASLDLVESDHDHHARAVLRIPGLVPWLPHTHGTPALYPVRVQLQLEDGTLAEFEDVPAGFRSIAPGDDDGLALKINNTPVFCRGVVWTPPDVVSLAATPHATAERLRLLRDGGFNMVRLAGTMLYESESFHRLCDELGLLVWQDMMFANMDYPFQEPGFHQAVAAEAQSELSRLSRHPSTAVICGNSEIEQQVGMLGLDAALGRGPFFGEELPALAAHYCPGVPYIASAPCGGDLPFRARSGVANYFGVGAYLRPLEDARRAGVRFASECLAFSNVPEPEMIEQMTLAQRGGLSPVHPAWKRGVPRDSGAGWDFEDVRDHYLKLLYSVDPMPLRYSDTARYWELSRIVSGETMAEVFGEWRRPQSTCRGGIILWGADLEPGAGWGILDSTGAPKAPYWFLKRALAPCTVWMTDEGLNGIDIHVANDRDTAVDAALRIALYRFSGEPVAASERAVRIPAHAPLTLGVEEVLGRFIDAGYAYRFGPPGHDVIVASLHPPSVEIPFAQSFRFSAGRPIERKPIAELGFTYECRVLAAGAVEILLSSRRFAWGVRIAASGFRPDDSYFGTEPGVTRRVVLTRSQPGDLVPKPVLTAVNAEGRLSMEVGARS